MLLFEDEETEETRVPRKRSPPAGGRAASRDLIGSCADGSDWPVLPGPVQGLFLRHSPCQETAKRTAGTPVGAFCGGDRATGALQGIGSVEGPISSKPISPCDPSPERNPQIACALEVVSEGVVEIAPR